MTQEVVTANRLDDGAVVYLTAEGDWSELIIDSRTLSNEGEREALLAEAAHAVARQEVVEPYVVAVKDDSGTIRPTRIREQIRAEGPSVRQHANDQGCD